MALTVKTRLVTAGNGDIQITVTGIPNTAKRVSMQVESDSATNGTVTVKMQESNTFAGTYKDISGATVAITGADESEYVDGGEFNGAFLNANVVVGTATLGTITLTINYK